MAADLLVYGLVAAGLVFWLRNILGTRQGDEHKRGNQMFSGADNPQSPGESNAQDDSALASPDNPGVKALETEDMIAMLADNRGGVMSIDNKTAENALLEIAKADKQFNIRQFLEAAQDAFVYIVEAFAEGDRDTLEGLLGKDVFNAFEAAIRDRNGRSETQETQIHAIRKAEVIEAAIRDRKARITVRFIADETSVTRAEDGDILHGDPDRVTEMRDIWTFERDIKSRDPRWLVVETRGDFDGDNDLIPDTH